jgi:prophage regulatory protein
MSPKTRRVLRLPATEAKSGLKRDSIYRLGRLGKFPQHVKLSKHASGWFEDEIDTWLAERAAERDAKSNDAGAGRDP